MSLILPSAMQPMPRRITRPLWQPIYWFSAMLSLMVLQLLCGTQIVFSLLVLVFCVLTYYAVRACGGLVTLTGFCTGCLAAQGVLISQVAKVIYWQPADSRLIRPVETMLVYDVAMLGIYFAILVANQLGKRRKPLFDIETDPRRLMWLAIVCTILSVGQAVYTRTQSVNADTGAAEVGGLHGILHVIAFLSPLAVASGTAYAIITSGGKRSLTLVNGIAIAVPCVFGLIGAGRQLMTLSIVVFYMTCFLYRFKFRPVHFAIILAGLYTAQFILFPYALYARRFTRTAHVEENIRRAVVVLGDVIANPGKYQQLSHPKHVDRMRFLYYGKPNATLDRFSLITITDGIVDATLREGTIGMETITPGLEMAVPRVLAPNKVTGYRNTLAHREPGMVGKHDYTTGITTGYVSDAFSAYGWWGDFVIPFLVTLLIFATYRFIVRDSLWRNVYGISIVLHLAWVYSGAAIAIQLTTLLQESLVFVIVLFLITVFAHFPLERQTSVGHLRMLANLRASRKNLSRRIRIFLPQQDV